jgi:hypothetical protein
VQTEQSSYVFKGCANQAEIDGGTVVLGVFTHHNHEIFMPFNTFQVQLRVIVTVEGNIRREFPISFSHYKSPNVGPVQDDEVTVVPVNETNLVQLNNVACDMKISGFYQPSVSPDIQDTFVSPENGSNEAKILVEFTRYSGAM